MLQKIGTNFKRPSLLKSLLTGAQVNINFYTLIYAIEEDNQLVSSITQSEFSIKIFCAYSSRSDAEKVASGKVVFAITTGQLIKKLSAPDELRLIGLNHNNGKFDEFVIVPFFDKLTKQYLLSPSDESIALLSIDKKTHQYMGVEATFFSINNKFIPEDIEKRKNILSDLVEDLAFTIPRLSQPKGSANIICLLLNLENPIEEKAFMRVYKTLDPYIEVIFVTSDLKLQTGNLEEINYDGESLEGVFSPLIERQINA